MEGIKRTHIWTTFLLLLLLRHSALSFGFSFLFPRCFLFLGSCDDLRSCTFLPFIHFLIMFCLQFTDVSCWIYSFSFYIYFPRKEKGKNSPLGCVYCSCIVFRDLTWTAPPVWAKKKNTPGLLIAAFTLDYFSPPFQTIFLSHSYVAWHSEKWFFWSNSFVNIWTFWTVGSVSERMYILYRVILLCRFHFYSEWIGRKGIVWNPATEKTNDRNGEL